MGWWKKTWRGISGTVGTVVAVTVPGPVGTIAGGVISQIK
jgi:hypothetical protein